MGNPDRAYYATWDSELGEWMGTTSDGIVGGWDESASEALILARIVGAAYDLGAKRTHCIRE